MSKTLIIREIQRFLASSEAQVLCIKGRWGVGKTYAWRYYLEEAQKAGDFHPQDYAYVSMFGLNSLDELRYAIFESTVPPENALSGPDAETFGKLVEKSKSLGRQARAWIGPVLSAVGLGEVGNAVARSAFLLVRNQLICLDDLERAGASLEPRDVLGLISFLKEQRNCRIVLLLNDEAMPDIKRKDFNRLLEKAVDTWLVFAPTALEAATIGIEDDKPVGELLRPGIRLLGITNIRVIKKIERLSIRLAELLQSHRPEVLAQAVTACLLAGWAVFEPDQAPKLAFVRSYNAVVAAMPGENNEGMEEMVRWRDAFFSLPFSHPDDFDQVVFDGVEVGYFDEGRLSAAAKTLEEALARNSRENSFAQAWDNYHESLQSDDDAVLDNLYRGALENLETIDALNINATIRFLREFGRDAEADNLAREYTTAQPDNPRFFDVHHHHFSAEAPADPALHAAFEARLSGHIDGRDPFAVLLAISRGESWKDEDIRLLANVTSDRLEAFIEGTRGPELRRVVRTALQIAGHNAHDKPVLIASLREALTRIAAKSPMRARRLKDWGFTAAVPFEEQSDVMEGGGAA
ncbi:MAG: hypothetical protein WC804_21845 [Sphingomonas sp.]|jgi:hypothetical protein|uniref:hypothetical protein n=1 Tax=Sphingomonas sp. TaxID=28214 RepID=UPI00356A049A